MFSNLKVVDASSVLAGPSVGMFFAELGANVVKVEHPIQKDVTRSWKLTTENKESEVSAYFSSVNYKKSYCFLDYKQSEDRLQFLELIKDADILLTNFKLGDAEKFQLTDALLFEINPRLIHGKISGFGTQSDRVAYDLILQAETGFMSMNGTPESGPVKMPVALIDVLAAHHLKEGLLIALLKRNEVDFKGKVVNVSLYDAAISSLVNQASNFLNAGHVAQRIGSLHPNIAPYGEIFTTKDLKQVTFAIGSDKHFQKLCEFLDDPNLVTSKLYSNNQNRVENRVELAKILQEKIALVDSAYLLNEMHKNFVPVGKIKSLDEVLSDEQVQPKIVHELIENVETQRITSIAFQFSDN